MSRSKAPCRAALATCDDDEGYWHCDVPGGCEDCYRLAVDIEDDGLVEDWDQEFSRLQRQRRAEGFARLQAAQTEANLELGLEEG